MSNMQAYNNAQKASLNGRELEAHVLKKSAYLIGKSIAAPSDSALFMQTWELTNDLWDVVQRDLMLDDCPLPAELRANLYSLSIFAWKRLIESAKASDPQILRPLIAIQNNLAEGLLGHAGGEETA